MNTALASTPEWKELRNVERTREGYRTTGHDPWLVSEDFDPPLPAQRCYLLVELTSSRRETMQIFWRGREEEFSEERSARFEFPASERPLVRVVDLNAEGKFGDGQAMR